MWVFTTSGFLSAVYKDGALQIRSRDRDSLEQLSHETGSKILRTPMADYPYRISTTRELFAQWLSRQALEIDYSNFKSEVAALKGYQFTRPLHKVWDAMHDIEDEEARIRP